jgi:hypothetical protein
MPSTDACCGSGCYNMKPIIESCNCGESRGNSYVACTDPEGVCGTPHQGGHLCRDFDVDCPEFTINVCVEGAPTPPPAPSPSPTPESPTPTPTPTPEPTCNPATKPNNTNCVCNTVLATAGLGDPFWDCGIGCSGATGADYPRYGALPVGAAVPPTNTTMAGTAVVVLRPLVRMDNLSTPQLVNACRHRQLQRSRQ